MSQLFRIESLKSIKSILYLLFHFILLEIDSVNAPYGSAVSLLIKLGENMSLRGAVGNGAIYLSSDHSSTVSGA